MKSPAPLIAVLFSLSLLFSGCETLEQFSGGGISTQITGGGVAQAEQPLPTVGLDSSAPTPGTAASSTATAPPAAVPVYTGPKIKVAVMGFGDETGDTTTINDSGGQMVIRHNPIGDGMSKQMITALMQSGMFRVFERQFVEDLLKEDKLTGRGDRSSLNLERPDYFIRGAVTEFEISNSQTNMDFLGGSFGGGSWDELFQGLVFLMSSGSDHVAIDVNIVNARTSEIVASISVEGKAKDLNVALGGMFGRQLVGVSGKTKAPIQKAIRACIIRAVNGIGSEMISNPDLISIRAANG